MATTRAGKILTLRFSTENTLNNNYITLRENKIITLNVILKKRYSYCALFVYSILNKKENID